MKCVYVLKGGTWPCQNCLPCRLYKRTVWASRIMLEAKSHEHSSFVTLTYSDEFLPSDLSVRPDDTRKWLYKLHNAFAPQRFRYYLVGEYGDTTRRPHYHVVLFGINSSELPKIKRTWSKGFVTCDPLSFERAQYIAGYVTKKLTKAGDPRLEGRHPEYSRQSRMGVGGIGASSVSSISNKLLTNQFVREELDEVGDVPSVLKHSGRLLPLGRYLRSKLRDRCFDKSWATQHRRERLRDERFYASVQLVREGSLTLEEFDKIQGFIRSPEKVDQTLLNLTAKFKQKKRKL